MSTRTSKPSSTLVRLLSALGVLALVVLLWRPLMAWFTGKPAGSTSEAKAPTHHHADSHASGHTAHTTTPAAPPAAPLPASALASVRAALRAYEPIRALLARDSLEGLSAWAEEMASALSKAATAAGKGASTRLAHGGEAARRLGATRSLEEARARFSEVSEVLVTLVAAEPRLQGGLHVFECPMVKGGFQKWLQRTERLENPYMGQRMLACGTRSDWDALAQSTVREGAPEDAQAGTGGEIAHHTCPMHPSVKQHGPGKCPICGMDLTPVAKTELQSGVILVDEARRQRIGVKTARVTQGPLTLSIRALGRVTYDERALQDVTLKLDGYIHALMVNATGQPVEKGDVLFTLYSPELYAAQQEYLLAREGQSETNASLVRASKRRLELWGLSDAQIARIAKRGEPLQYVPFLSPASGFVIEKNVVEGAAVKAGERLFRLASLHNVWVEADVYEQDLPQVEVGQAVEISLPYRTGKRYRGRVAYVYPALEGSTRTGKVRIELPNEGLALKPDMYADVHFEVHSGERVQVPESAILHTGPRTLVFVDMGEGRFKPVEVELGLRGEDTVEVVEGLKVGDVVVTSGNFLIAAESRLRTAAGFWSGGEP